MIAETMRRITASGLLVAAACSITACAPAGFHGTPPKRAEEPPQPAHDEPPPPAPQPLPPEPQPEAPPTLDPPPSKPPVVDEPDVPTECVNTVGSTGVHDAARGLTFKLMPDQLAFDAGVAACKNAASGGRLIYRGQDLPDEVLACQKALGTLWLDPKGGGSNLWQPSDGGVVDRAERHWIICFY